MEFFEVINKRRSVREFLADEIPIEILNNILEAGRLAPSGGNAQNFYFGVIKEKLIKEKLAEAAGGQKWIATAPVVIALCAKISLDIAELPVTDFGLIVNKTRFGEELIRYLNRFPDRKSMKIFWENADPLIPGEHIFLAAINYGLNACWVGYLDTKKASEILDLPEDMVCLFLMPIGYAKSEPEKKWRRPFMDAVFYERWDKK